MECPNCKSKDIIQEFKIIETNSVLERSCRQAINTCKKCGTQFQKDNDLRKKIMSMR